MFYKGNSMATHKSALKRHRQSLKRNRKNRTVKAEIHTLTKKLASVSKEEAPALLKTLQSKIDKAGRRSIIHSKNASHRVSKLMRATSAK